MGKILRLVILCVIMGVFFGLSDSVAIPMEPIIGAVFVGFSFYLFWDLLEFLYFSTFTLVLKQILF